VTPLSYSGFTRGGDRSTYWDYLGLGRDQQTRGNPHNDLPGQKGPYPSTRRGRGTVFRGGGCHKRRPSGVVGNIGNPCTPSGLRGTTSGGQGPRGPPKFRFRGGLAIAARAERNGPRFVLAGPTAFYGRRRGRGLNKQKKRFHVPGGPLVDARAGPGKYWVVVVS